jgi:two-component system response regulator MprA
MEVLIVEDDDAVRDSLRRSLAFEGYRVRSAGDGEEALREIDRSCPDAVVLDLQLPRLDGLEVCRQLRSRGNVVPVLVLTARDGTRDRVTGLDAGADDYLPKPFALEELLARLRAMLRRARIADNSGSGRDATAAGPGRDATAVGPGRDATAVGPGRDATAAGPEPGRSGRESGRAGPEGPDPAEELIFGDLRMNLVTREVTRNRRAITLTRTEFSLLELFLRNPLRVLERGQILHEVWGFDFEPGSNTLEVYVGYLRRKTEEWGEPRMIHNVRGVGYVLRPGTRR